MEDYKLIMDFIKSDFYQHAIEYLINKTQISINQNYSEKYAKIDSLDLQTAGIDISELSNILEKDFEKVLLFAENKILKFKDEKDDIGEIPKGEEVEAEDSKTIQLGFSKSFLLMYLIEYYFLKNNSKGLYTYIKALRIPNSKKYIKELDDIYKNIG